MKKTCVVLTALTLLFSGCLLEPEENVPQSEIDVTDFYTVWESFESFYPLFIEKDIDWVEVAREYYPMALEVESVEELSLLTADMISILEDPSLFVITPSGERVYPFMKEYTSNVDMSVLMDNYLVPNGFVDHVEGFGWCDPAVLPYAFFDSLPTSFDTLAAPAFDDFIGACVDEGVPAIILDIRMNPFARRKSYRYSHYVMSRFLEHSRIGAVYRYRVGPEYDMLSDYHPAIDAAGPNRFYGTVYLLIGGECLNGSEDMAANMNYFPNTITVGDTTGGSCNYINMVSCGQGTDSTWSVAYGRGTTLTHDYHYIEGVGVPPDLYVESTEADFAAGIDPVMEYAMGLIQ